MRIIPCIPRKWTGWVAPAVGNHIRGNNLIGAEVSKGHLVIGDANEAIDKILHMQEMFGLTRFSAHMDVGGPLHASMMKSIEIFGTKDCTQSKGGIKIQ